MRHRFGRYSASRADHKAGIPGHPTLRRQRAGLRPLVFHSFGQVPGRVLNFVLSLFYGT